MPSLHCEFHEGMIHVLCIFIFSLPILLFCRVLRYSTSVLGMNVLGTWRTFRFTDQDGTFEGFLMCVLFFLGGSAVCLFFSCEHIALPLSHIFSPCVFFVVNCWPLDSKRMTHIPESFSQAEARLQFLKKYSNYMKIVIFFLQYIAECFIVFRLYTDFPVLNKMLPG